MKLLFTKLILLCLVSSSMLFTGCGKKTEKTLARTSYELSGLVGDVDKGIERLFDERIISLATKDKWVGFTGKMIKGGKKGHAMLEGFLKVSPTLTQDQIRDLDKIFSDEVITPFLELLQEIKVLTPTQSDYLRATIAALRVAVLAISGAFASAGFPGAERRLINAS